MHHLLSSLQLTHRQSHTKEPLCITTYSVWNPGLDLGQAQKSGWVKLGNGIPTLTILILAFPMAIHIKIKNKNLHIFTLTQKDHTHHKNEWQHKNGQYGYDVTDEYNNNGFEDLNLQIWNFIFYMCHLTELGNEWQENYTTYTNSLIAIDKFRVISILEISIFSLHPSPMVLRKSYWCVDEGCNSNDRENTERNGWTL